MEISTKKKRFDGQIIVFLTSIDIKILNAMKGNHYLHRSLENLIPLIVSFLPVAAEREAINSSNMNDMVDVKGTCNKVTHPII